MQRKTFICTHFVYVNARKNLNTHFRWYDAPYCPYNHIEKSMKSNEEHYEISQPYMISGGMLERYINKAEKNRSPRYGEKEKGQAR